MNGILIQFISLIIGAFFLFMSFWFSRKREHFISPVVIIIAAFFIFCGLFHAESLFKTLVLEQVACWVVALLFLVAAFRFLQKEKISLAFTVFILAAIFFFCSLSGVQSLLKTGMLSTVTNTLIKYGDKLDDFQITMANMKTDLSKQQAQIEKQQAIITEAQLVVSDQQIKISDQNNHIIYIQNILASAQSNVDAISTEMVEQQRRLDAHQKELENQQAKIREACPNNQIVRLI